MELNLEYLFKFTEETNNNANFKIRPGSLVGKKQIYGILDYNKTDDEDNKKLFHKHSVYFSLYGKPKDSKDKKGQINLLLDSGIDYEFNPSIKFEHSGLSLYNWFVNQQKEGKFKNRRDWFEIYDLMKLEGLYYPNPKDGYTIKNSNFNSNMKYLKDSLREDTTIIEKGLFSTRHFSNLLKMKDVDIYDIKKDDFYPQLHIYKDISLDETECYIYINFYPDNVSKNKLEQSQINKDIPKIEFIGLEKESVDSLIDSLIDSNVSTLRNDEFKDIYKNKDDNYKDSYHILTKIDKNEIANYGGINLKKPYIWEKKRINNFKEYLNLITDNIQLNNNARDRVRGLYEIDKKFMDEEYLNYLEDKKSKNPHLEEIDGIIKKAKQNLNSYNRKINNDTKFYSLAHGYPFWVIYKFVDYNGDPCQEESKNSQKLFLTTKILPEHVISEETTVKDYTSLNQYPFIKEEFISFTGYGNDIQFYGKKLGGSTNIMPKQFCNYPSLPIEECTAETCAPKKLGLVRMDGSPKCQISDDTVKQKSETPNFVEIIGNISENACDLFKLKGNKKLYYRLGRIFKYGRDGKYQLKNMYTIQQTFDNRYFFFIDDKISLKTNLDTSKIDYYTFVGEPMKDSYGMYYVFKPKTNAKYLTRKINVFNRQFEEWKLEDLKDINQVQRNKEDTTRVHKDDPDYYSQKFSIPKELIINMATQDGIKNSAISKITEELTKQESLRCKTSPQLCEGDRGYEAAMSPLEENKFLNKQLDDTRNMMNKLNQIPASFTEPPNMVGLAKKINQLRQIIPKIEINIINTIKANQFMLDLDNVRKNEEDKQVLLKKQEKINISDNSNMDNTKENKTDKSFYSSALKGIKNTFGQAGQDQPKCYSLENFSNYNTNSNLNKHISDQYSDYIAGKMGETKDSIADMQKVVGQNLDKIGQLASSIKMDGNGKQLLMYDKINQDNDLNKDILKIKNNEQQSRIVNILKKIEEIENIRSEMEEDDFKTTKQPNEDQYKTLISREDGETINIYKAQEAEVPEEMIFSPSDSNHNLLFVNEGCLSYDDNLNISQEHCMIGDTKQMFQIHRVEDVDDMKKYNIKNHNKGMERPYSIVMADDNKCLHKEDNQLSFRKCDNIQNQYWDYSNITGANN